MTFVHGGDPLSAQDVLYALSHAEHNGFLAGVWYCVNAPQQLVDAEPEHTLAGALGLTAAELQANLTALGLWNGNAETWQAKLNDGRMFTKLQLFWQNKVSVAGLAQGMPAAKARFIAFGVRARHDDDDVVHDAAPPQATPQEQVKGGETRHGGLAKQPKTAAAVFAKVHKLREDRRASEARKRSLRRNRSESPPQRVGSASPQRERSRAAR